MTVMRWALVLVAFAATAAASVSAQELSANDAYEKDTVQVRTRSTESPDAFFGQYRLRLSGARTRMDDGIKYYDTLYGSASNTFSFGVDWFPSKWAPRFFAIGVSGRTGFYRDNGHASASSTNVKPLKSSPSELTILPFQFGLTAQGTLLKEKWVVVEGWALLERSYWQETRTTGSATSSARISPVAGRMATDSSESSEEEEDALVNRGWKNGIVSGLAVNLLLNFLDETSIRSQRGVFGIGYFYLTVFTEKVIDAGGTGMSFARSNTGIAFTFESVH